MSILLEYKINEYNPGWNTEQKRAFVSLVLGMIAELKTYCEIEIYLIHLSETTKRDIEKVKAGFYSRYQDQNEKQAEFTLVKYGTKEKVI